MDGKSAIATLLEKLLHMGKPELPSDQDWPQWFDSRLEEYERQNLKEMHIPEIVGEEDFERKLREHKDKLMVIKFWKHKCVPCLAYGPFMKKASVTLQSEQPDCVFYSLDIKRDENRSLSMWQRITGTPTVQYFYGHRQIGHCVEETSYEAFTSHVRRTLAALGIAKE
eukprot:NODE_4958_length_738_cov_23.359942_g4602_i0.p2 GENE.NODE_4958_length_738_cov_23.359942_g4602_i0~~NODE_4958_length_738_cov_23.359942_g4602_i0.p2  ORF type:complete len:168 (+),score=38.79 NODE_4958_length_738_cov_23.359942_g4602_i0:119-622(+)